MKYIPFALTAVLGLSACSIDEFLESPESVCIADETTSTISKMISMYGKSEFNEELDFSQPEFSLSMKGIVFTDKEPSGKINCSMTMQGFNPTTGETFTSEWPIQYSRQKTADGKQFSYYIDNQWNAYELTQELAAYKTCLNPENPFVGIACKLAKNMKSVENGNY